MVVILLYIQFYVPFVLNINIFSMLSVLNRILWLQPLPLSFYSIVSWFQELEGRMGCLLAHPGTCCNAVWMDVGIPGTVPDWPVTKAYGLVGEIPRLMPQPCPSNKQPYSQK